MDLGKKSIFDAMERDIMHADISDADKQRFLANVLKMKATKVNIMITGATGSGKSSTINAMFNMEVAKVGVGVDPETLSIDKYGVLLTPQSKQRRVIHHGD